MLVSLGIRDVVLVDRLEVKWEIRRDVREPASVGEYGSLAKNGCTLEHRETEHRHDRVDRGLARKALDDAHRDGALL